MIATLQRYALAALAILLVLVGAYKAGTRAARRSFELEQAEAEAKRLRAANKGMRDAKEHVANLPAGGAADELRRDWMRDDD